MNETPLYPYSAEVARRRDELSLWRASHRANIACKEAIEEAVRQHFDGAYLDRDCLDSVLLEYGHKRTAWVLANTVQQLEWDGRFSARNKAWASQISIPADKRHNLDFVVTSHPAVLDGVIDQYRKDCPDLGLLWPERYEREFWSREQEADRTEQMTCAMNALQKEIQEGQKIETPNQGGMTMK